MRQKLVLRAPTKKLVILWLNEAFCFASISVEADNFVIRKKELLIPT